MACYSRRKREGGRGGGREGGREGGLVVAGDLLHN